MITANPVWEYIRLVTFILMSKQYMIGAVIHCTFASNQSGIFMSLQVQGLSHIGLCWNTKKEKKKFLQLMAFNSVIWNNAKKLAAFLGLPS